FLFFLLHLRPLSSTLFPYTTLFRSIFAFSRHVSTQRKVALYRGVHPVAFDTEAVPCAKDFMRAIDLLKSKQILADGDLVIVSCRSEEHTSELQSRENLVCRLLLEKK